MFYHREMNYPCYINMIMSRRTIQLYRLRNTEGYISCHISVRYLQLVVVVVVVVIVVVVAAAVVVVVYFQAVYKNSNSNFKKM